MSAKDAATKAKTHVVVNKITIEITDDQKSRIDVFKQNKNIDKTDEAVEELVDIGLAASEDL